VSYKEATAKVVQVARSVDAATVTVEVSRLPSEPLAPAGLYTLDNTGQEVIQLHKLIAASGNILTYEIYDDVDDWPEVDSVYIHRVWWTLDQLEAVTDASRKWTFDEYPDNGEHDHCLLTWNTIAAYADHKTGYHSGKDWITEEAYKTYIVDDKLRLRHRAKSS